jgi:hypothetical protein
VKFGFGKERGGTGERVGTVGRNERERAEGWVGGGPAGDGSVVSDACPPKRKYAPLLTSS